MKIITSIAGVLFKRKVFVAFFCWLFLIIYELSVFYYTLGSFPPLVRFLLYYSCNISLFYCQIGLLNSFVGQKKGNRYWTLSMAIIAELAVFLSIKVIIDFTFLDQSLIHGSLIENLKMMGTLDLFRNIYYAAFGTLYWAIININEFQRKADAAEIAQLKADNNNSVLQIAFSKVQNAYLQQQLNPHLLFNALDFIHSRVNKYSADAADAVILLADIMRYSLEVSQADEKTALTREIEQVHNLIKINRYRFEDNSRISINVDGVSQDHQIVPLALLTLTENVLKHGDLTNRSAVIRLSVTQDHELRFSTFNYKKGRAPFKQLKSTGLENLNIRLNYSYGQAYTINISETEETYETELKLQL